MDKKIIEESEINEEIDYEQQALDKIDEGKELDEKFLRDLAHGDYGKIVEQQDGEDRRWQRSVYTVVRLKDRYFSLCWEQGLTENHEDEFFEQPSEVFPKTVVVPSRIRTQWVPKKAGGSSFRRKL